MTEPRHIPVNDRQALESAGLRVSAVRLLIWRTIRHDIDRVFSLADVESLLPTVDRSTIFRALVAFTDAYLLHEVDDGSGLHKYCVCHFDDTRHCHGHVYLTCTRCRRTYCLPNIEIPAVPLPPGFTPETTEYLIKGVCQDCQAS